MGVDESRTWSSAVRPIGRWRTIPDGLEITSTIVHEPDWSHVRLILWLAATPIHPMKAPLTDFSASDGKKGTYDVEDVSLKGASLP